MPNNSDALITLGLDINKSVIEIDKQLPMLEKKLNNIKLNAELNTDDIKNINTQINALSKNIKPIDIKLNINGNKTFNATSSFADQGIQAGQSFSNNFNRNINIKLDTSKIDITNIETNLKRLHNPSEELQNKIKQLSTDFNELNNIQDSDKKVQSYSKLKEEISNTRKEVNSLIKAQGQQISVFDKSKLDNSMQSWLNDNTKAADKFGGRVKELQSLLATVDDKSGLTNILKQFQSLQKEAKMLGVTGRSTVDELKNNITKFAGWFGISQVIMLGVNALKTATKEMIVNVRDLDSVYVDLQQATGKTRQEVSKLIDTYYDLGNELGANVIDVANSASDWLRQGKSIAETNELIRDSMILSKIGQIDSAQATTYLTSAMKAYGIASKDVINIVDKLSAVDMSSATDVAGLAEGMNEVSSAANLAGVSMDKLLGYLAVIGEITGESMSSVGTSLNAMFSRMGNIKLSRLADYQNGGEDLSNVETVLRGLDIKLRDTNDSFRNFSDVLDEVASRWNSFTEVQQRAIASSIAGTNHMNSFITLMGGYGTSLEYTEVAMNASGTAMEKFGAYEESVEAKTERLKNSFIQLSETTINSNFIKDFFDLANGVVQATNSIGGLVPVVGALSSAFIIQKFLLPFIIKEMGALIAAETGVTVTTLKQIIAQTGLNNAFSLSIVSIKSLALAMKSFLLTNPAGWAIIATTAVIGLVGAFNKYEEAQTKARQKSIDLTNEYKSEKRSLEEQIESYKELTKQLKGNNLTTEETRVIKNELSNLQDTLVQKYGFEAKAIDLVNGKYDEQINKLSDLSKKKASEYLALNKNGYEKAKQNLDNTDTYSLNGDYGSKISNELQNYLSKYDGLNTEIFNRGILGDYTKVSVANATQQEYYDILTKLYTDLGNDLEKSSEIENFQSKISEFLTGIDKTTIDENQDMVDTYVKAAVISNNILGDLYNKSADAIKEYNVALSSGKGIEEARENLKSIESLVRANLHEVEGSESAFKEYFDLISDGAQDAKNTLENNSTKSSFDIAINKESIDNFQKSIVSIKDTLSNLSSLSSTEIIDLMQEFSDFNWERYGVTGAEGVGNLEGALKSLSREVLYTATSNMPELTEAFTAMFNEINSGSSDIDNLIVQLDDLYSVLARVKKGQKLSAEEIAGLINKHSELASAIIVTSNGYSIEEEALKSLINTQSIDANISISTQIEKTNTIIEQTRSRIEAYSAEAQAIDVLVNAYDSQYESLRHYLLENGDQAASEKFGIDTVKNYRVYMGDKFNLGNALNELEKLKGQLKTSTDYQTKTSLDKTTKGSSFSNQIDWIKESVNKLETEMKRYQSILDNTSSISNQIKYTKKLISTQSQLRTAYSKSSDTYGKEYNNALSKLSLDDQKKVKNGKYSIENFNDKNVKSGETGANEKRYNDIQNAIKLRDAFNDSTISVIQAESKLKEYAESLASIRWDKSTEKCDKLTKDIDLLNAKMENSVGYKAENRYLDKILEKYKDIYSAKKKAVTDTDNDIKITKKSINKKYKTKDRINSNGTLKTTGVTNSTQLGYITEYNALVLQQVKNNKELLISEQELKSTISDNALAKFDNIANHYEQRTGIVDKKKERLDKELDILEAKGLSAGKAYYDELIRLEDANVDYLNKELSKLQTQLDSAVRSGDVTKYSPKWYEMVNAIYDVKSAIQDCTLNTIEFKKAIDQVGFDNLDRLISRLSSLQKESDFLIDLMSNTELIDKNGSYTNTGLATQGQHGQNYNNYMYQADEYAKQIKAWDSKYGNLNVGDENYNYYIEKRDELIASQQELIKSAESEKKAMIDLAKEGIQVQIDAYKEAINKQKELLDAEKDLADFQKSLTKKRQNAAMIQKRLNAISGDDSDEKRKLRKQLEKELAEAKDDLESFEKDKYIQNQKKELDESVTQYEKEMKDYMKNTDLIFSETLSTINANSNSIANTIKNTASNVGYSISSQITSAWTTAGNSVTAYSSKFQSASVGMLSVLSKIKEAYDDAALSAEALAKASVKSIKSDNSSITSSTALSKNERAAVEKILNNGKGSGKGRSELNKYITDVLGKKNQISYEQAVQLAKLLGISGVTKKEDMIGNTAKKNEILEALKKAGFSKGGIVGEINDVIGENGDHGIATVRTDEVMLDPKESKVFKDFVKLSPDYLDTMNPVTKYGINDSIRKEDNTVQQGINVTITAPLVNVENMDENMLYKMKNDKKIQQTMQDIVLGQSISGIKNSSSGRNLRR